MSCHRIFNWLYERFYHVLCPQNRENFCSGLKGGGLCVNPDVTGQVIVTAAVDVEPDRAGATLRGSTVFPGARFSFLSFFLDKTCRFLSSSIIEFLELKTHCLPNVGLAARSGR